MHQAGNNKLRASWLKAMLIAFVISVMFAFLQPQEALSASQSAVSQAQSGQVSFVAFCISALSLSKVDLSSHSMKLSSYEDEKRFVEALETPAEKKSNLAVYASAKQPQELVVSESAGDSNQQSPKPLMVSEQSITTESAAGLQADAIFDLVNAHRTSIGLSAVQKDDRVMQVAISREPELFDEIFVNGNMHAGFYARNLPYTASEIVIYFNTEEGAVNWWLHSPVHRGIIENASYTHAGIGCAGKACSMIFASL